MKDEEENLGLLDRKVPRKRGLSFSYLVTVALMILVLFAGVKYYSEGKGAPADPVTQSGTHEASR